MAKSNNKIDGFCNLSCQLIIFDDTRWKHKFKIKNHFVKKLDK